MPLVSVIMGVYNCKNFNLLYKSVDSIIHQTFSDWEFIICNDGSTNETYDELKKIRELDSRIRIISYDENRGLSFALNVCMKEAEGKFIARQDDDDISKPERLLKQIEFLEKHPQYDIVGTNAVIFDNSGIWGEYITPEKPMKDDFLWNSPFIHPSVMIKVNSLKKVECYRVARETRRCEDYDLFMRMYAMGYKGYNLQEKLYCYRMVNDSKQKYRPMKYRIDEMIVRFKGYRKLKILKKGLIYIFKPMLLGLMPQCLLYVIKKKQFEI